MKAWVYFLRLASGTIYIGHTRFLSNRILAHLEGFGCRTTRLDPPISLERVEVFSTLSEAKVREVQVKQWTRAKKEALIRGDLVELKRLAKRRKP